MIYLHTSRLIIRDHIPEDLETHFALFSNQKAMYYTQWKYMKSVENAQADLEKIIREADKKDRKQYFFRIEDRQKKIHIGEIGYSVRESTPLGKLVGVGYFLHPGYWSQGYATEALREVTCFAFEKNGVYRIEADCMKENTGSEKVMMKCGMIKEAEFKDYTWHDGRMKSRVNYRLLKPEWELGRRA